MLRTHTALLRLLTVCYLAVMGLYVFQGQLWQIHYLLHKKTIARLYCENRDNALMHCEGKCYLHKKLLAAEESKPQDTPTLSPLFYPWFFQKAGICMALPVFVQTDNRFPPYAAKLKSLACDIMPPPPKV